ncbi:MULTISPECIES: energy-coupling factor transporter transmembrane component T family protein [Pseudonocardia]|uniref:Energy-coupling factor transport system permease protein n=2 Tax=Pseudonocardia TaxID=1847 RepID=A0ABQ0RW99_9PSEU|nr:MULTISPECIES: energy-coupling factor transporter transmembrane component T [Pseudonocardia]OSY40830.1 putative HMP/thiamine permease protein YkoC [Pseudonocardia autotrophica]TDN71862.1 energy-coupling factor transport system permease protein [Pseudonocardia autotrophica]BBG02550.1 hypothetical protein Pdca_37590 [Pseudonocardia autotrophica]GEC24609.1 hypothetical protein PSA01_16380 [Pseudonocardia saturnea]
MTGIGSAPRPGFLRRVNPLAKIAGPLPAMAYLSVTRDPWVPGVLLVAAALLVVAGSGLGPRRLGTGLLVGLLLVGTLTVSFTLLAGGATVDADPSTVAIGPLEVRASALYAGLSTALRMTALMGLTLVGGLTTDATDLVRALIRTLRVPYRYGYGAIASYRFVGRFSQELHVIRAAHRARGVADRNPVRRAGRMAVPLLAGGIRHAERVAVAMDARAFGAHPTRTERRIVRFRPSDAVFVLACWAFSVATVVVLDRQGLVAPLVFLT